MVPIASTARNFLLLVAVLCLTGSCGRKPDPQADANWTAAMPETPNVLLVVVDTLRADHLGIYGYLDQPTSPFLDSLQSESITVEGLTGVSSWTMPSMATLFSGQSPAEHRVMRMRGADSNLGPLTSTLAATFRKQGYATACVMSNFLLLSGRGFNEGFDLYDDHLARNADPHRGSTAEQVAATGIQWLNSPSAQDKPWFLTLHFFDPHTSYEDQADWEFTDPHYQGWVQGGLTDEDYKANQQSASAADRKQLSAYYDEEIRAVDHALRKVIAELKNRNQLENTILVFTSDHGEELAERGYIGHTRTLHFEQIDLPLMVRLPNAIRGGTRRNGLMGQSSLYASILDLAGLPIPTQAAPSMADWLLGLEGGEPSPTAFFEVDFMPIKLVSKRRIQKRGMLQGDRYKFVQDLKTGTDYLYDLQQDPKELVNRIADPALAEVILSMRLQMDKHVWY